MTYDIAQLGVKLGVTDKAQSTPWNGSIEVTNGKLLDLKVTGDPKGVTKGKTFRARSFKRAKRFRERFARPTLTIIIGKTTPQTRLQIDTKQGKLEFALAELADGGRKFLKGRVLAAPPGSCTTSTHADILEKRVLAGNFDLLVPEGNGEQMRLKRYDGKIWHKSIGLSERGQSIWRPTITTLGEDRLHAA